MQTLQCVLLHNEIHVLSEQGPNNKRQRQEAESLTMCMLQWQLLAHWTC